MFHEAFTMLLALRLSVIRPLGGNRSDRSLGTTIFLLSREALTPLLRRRVLPMQPSGRHKQRKRQLQWQNGVAKLQPNQHSQRPQNNLPKRRRQKCMRKLSLIKLKI